MKSDFHIVFGATLTFALLAQWASTSEHKQREPLPLDVVASVSFFDQSSEIDLSPDGSWLAYSIRRYGAGEEAGAAGHPGQGTALETQLVHTKSGQLIRLTDFNGSSWAPAWSPDGEYLAYIANEGGEAGIWLWERRSGQKSRFPGVIPHPHREDAPLRWSADGQRLLCKVDAAQPRSHAAHIPRDSFARVLKFPDTELSLEAESKPRAELSVLDISTRQSTRVTTQMDLTWYAFSPKGIFIAYTERYPSEVMMRDRVELVPGNHFRLNLYDLTSGKTRVLSSRIRLAREAAISWSPDGRQIAYVADDLASIHVIDASSGSVVALKGGGIPGFSVGEGSGAPIWDERGMHLYALGQDGGLWRMSVATGKASLAASIPGYRIRAVMTGLEQPKLWTTGHGPRIWVEAKASKSDKAGIFSIELSTQKYDHELIGFVGRTRFDVSSATGEITYIAGSQQRMPDAWLFDTMQHQPRQVTHLNNELDKYEYGVAKTIEYAGPEGQKLRSALLLPPGWQPGRSLPLVVWVYGGGMGSQYVNTFGFWSEPAFNMHVLATRGYGVLFPDVPVRQGQPLKDIYDAVARATDAAVDQGFADEHRMAVMGQSYGSYSVLALITQTTRFKAAVLTGSRIHPDLLAQYLSMGRKGEANEVEYFESGQGGIGGGPWQFPQRYRDNSPIYLFDKIQTPVLIGHGVHDTPVSSADAIFVALRRLGKEVEYRLYEDEGHAIQRRVNVIDFWSRRLEFLNQKLRSGLKAHQIAWVVSP